MAKHRAGMGVLGEPLCLYKYNKKHTYKITPYMTVIRSDRLNLIAYFITRLQKLEHNKITSNYYYFFNIRRERKLNVWFAGM